jgi:S1-C subfamily serine protease
MALVLEGLSSDWSEMVERVRPSLVHVIVQGRRAGAGTIWHPQGLIVTNAHVVERGGLRIQCLDGAELDANLVAADPRLDLAALSVEAVSLPEIELGTSRQLRPGELVMALGHPWGVAHAATLGMVIGVGSDLPESPLPGREWIAVSLHLRPGHSGGALIDGRGRLIGINTIMAGPDIGMAIPVDVAKRFVQDAIGGRLGLRRRAA